MSTDKERYKNFIEHSFDGIYYMNCKVPISINLPLEEQLEIYYENACFEECNLALAQMYGYSDPKQLIGKCVKEIHAGPHIQENKNSFRLFVNNQYRVNNVETIERDIQGKFRYFSNHAVGIIKNQYLVGVWGTQQDITDKKLAEKALKESQERLDLVITGANLGTWDWDIPSGKCQFNKHWANMLGFDLEEIEPILDSFIRLIHPNDLDESWKKIQDHIVNKTDFFELEFRMRTKTGGWRWIYDKGRVVVRDGTGIPLRASGIHIDITERKNAEKNLEDSLSFLKSLYDESPLGIGFSDPKGKIIQVNRQHCRIIGYEESEIIGRTYLDITYTADVDYELKVVRKAVKEKKSLCQFEKRYVHKDGRLIWVNVALSMIYSEDGILKYSIGMVEDISEKKKIYRALKESEALQKAIIDALPDLKFRLSKEGVFQSYYIQSQAEKSSYLSPEEFLNKSIDEVLPEPIAKAFLRNAALAVQTRQVQSFEYALPQSKGLEFYEARINAINKEEVLAVIRNISERKKVKDELEEKIRELDIKNKELQKYIDSNMQLENFAYIASHDLREPVRTMRTFAQLLQKRYGDSLDESAQKFIHFIVDGANNMNNLINDLLTYSRVNTGEQEVAEIITLKLVEQVIEGLAGSINQKNVKIEIGKLPKVIVANPTKMKQLLQNLIANAVKFSSDGRRPMVTIKALSKSAFWEFSIADNGIGIDPDYQEQIFFLFKKLHPRGKYTGTGLGLAICKKIVEQHEGRIWVESTPEKGSTFSFTIKKP